MYDMSVDSLFLKFGGVRVGLGVRSVVAFKVPERQFRLLLTDILIAEMHFRSANNRSVWLAFWICRESK